MRTSRITATNKKNYTKSIPRKKFEEQEKIGKDFYSS